MSDLRSAPRWEWTPVDRPGCHGVEGRIAFAGPDLAVVFLRFEPWAASGPHAAPHRVDAVCIEGAGFVLTGDREVAMTEGQSIHWPPGREYGLRTAGSPMTVMLLERVGPGSGLQ
jgi:quercetin dioxygenase-like cupin family protein